MLYTRKINPIFSDIRVAALDVMYFEWSYIFPRSRINLSFVVSFIFLGDIGETKLIREATLIHRVSGSMRGVTILRYGLESPQSQLNLTEELIDHWHNAQLMHPGGDKMQQDLEWRFKFPPVYYAILDKYCSDCAVCPATKSPNHSTAGSLVYTAILEAPMRSVAMDVFAMPEVTVEGETYDCVILAVDRHSGYIVAVPGKKSKKKDKKDKHGVGLQAKTVANAMIRHWLTFFDVPAVICSDPGSQFVGTWFKTMCKHMGIRHAKTGGMAGLRWPAGRCSRSSASCTLTNRAGIGTIRCGE